MFLIELGAYDIVYAIVSGDKEVDNWFCHFGKLLGI